MKKDIEKKKPKISRGMLLQLTANRLDEEGFAIGSAEGKKICISGALPGETVEARVEYAGRETAFAHTTRIITRSPARTHKKVCTVRDCCSCPLVQVKYDDQLRWKRDLVLDEFRKFESLQKVEILPTLASPRTVGYRNSAKLVIGGKNIAPIIGMYRRNTHDVVEIGGCALHHPLINRIIEVVREGIRKGKIPVYSPRTGNGLLRYLVIRVSEAREKAMVLLITNDRGYNEIHHLAKFIREKAPEVEVVAQNVNTSSGNVIFGARDIFQTKQQHLEDQMEQVRFSISPRSFFQVNSGSAKIIYEQVRAWGELSGRETVADLYCGIGGISLFLADAAREVYGMEVVESAVIDARRNASLNGIRNCRFEAGDAVELLEDLREERKTVDLLVLNPPRKGCDRRVLEEAALVAPKKIIYVSCSPASLARDLDILSGRGYQVVKVQPVDMFPQTLHVENVALLVKQ